ncbi:hypothetical protein, partial [Sphingobium sp.]|uniref:hypothetical protein n=1 Tax=Sphingobium sp. TaxID=1912891 RepID=UPI00257ED86A
RSSFGMAGSLRRDIVGLLVAHYARPHTEILTVPGDCVIQAGISVAKGNVHKISAAIRFVYFLT